MSSSRWARAAAWTTAAVLGASLASGIGWAAASGNTHSTTTTTKATGSRTPSARAHRKPPLLRRLEHGQLTLRAKSGTTTVDLQRGTVSALTATTVSVTSKDGHAATYAVTSASKVHVKGKLASLASVHDGDRVMVIGSGGDIRQLRDPQRAATTSS